MLAFQLSSENPSGKVVEVPIPDPQPHEALIQVLQAGICNTDLEIVKGYMGFSGTLGHEFVGKVVEFGSAVSESDQRKFLHQRVCGDINLACAGRTATCNICSLKTTMSRNHCPTRTVLGILNKDGTMAEYLTLPVSNLHLVSDALSNEEAVFCEPLAAACRIVEQNLVKRFDKVVILGDGKLGLMIAEAIGRHVADMNHNEEETAASTTPKPILIGKHAHKLELVKDAGVEIKLLNEITDDNGDNDGSTNSSAVKSEFQNAFDVVVDATGSPSGLALCVNLTSPMGTLVLKSTCADTAGFFAAPVVINEISIVGSRCGPFPPALKLLEHGNPKLHVTKYITETFALRDASQAMECAAQKSTMKVQLICSTEDE